MRIEEVTFELTCRSLLTTLGASSVHWGENLISGFMREQERKMETLSTNKALEVFLLKIKQKWEVA